jgi:rhodanese-related sulfurtransferase
MSESSILQSNQIPVEQVMRMTGLPHAQLIIDVRREAVFSKSNSMIAGSVRRDPAAFDVWRNEVPQGSIAILSCAHGHQISQVLAAQLRAQGVRAVSLAGGIEAYLNAGGTTVSTAALSGRKWARPTKWITRERPKIDRIACPWLIRRFVDPLAEFLFVDRDWVADGAVEAGAIPFDIPDVQFSHRGEDCTFDTMLKVFELEDPALNAIAPIIRGADTGRLDLAPQAAGLLAISLGLSALERDDLAMLERGFTLYDGLYSWAKSAAAETHNWTPK